MCKWHPRFILDLSSDAKALAFFIRDPSHIRKLDLGRNLHPGCPLDPGLNQPFGCNLLQGSNSPTGADLGIGIQFGSGVHLEAESEGRIRVHRPSSSQSPPFGGGGGILWGGSAFPFITELSI